MLEKAKRLLQPSGRSAVPAFMVMDVVAAATRLEAQGRRIVHMEVGQPAAGAPTPALDAARAALSAGPLGYTETLGIASLRRRIARAYAEWHGIDIDSRAHRGDHRFFVRFHSRVSRSIRSGRSRRDGAAGLSAIPSHFDCARLRAGLDRDERANALVDDGRRSPRAASRAATQRRGGGFAGQSDRHDDAGIRSRGVRPMRPRCRHRRYLGRDLPWPGLCLRGNERRRLILRRHHHQFILQIFLHDRMADRLDGGAAGAGARRRAVAAESRDLGADTLADRG